jgi:UDPglucose 6-dehydrogenase
MAEETDALVLVTEWPQYRELPWEQMAQCMRRRLLLDGRNFLDRETLVRLGFRYVGVGVPEPLPQGVRG